MVEVAKQILHIYTLDRFPAWRRRKKRLKTVTLFTRLDAKYDRVQHTRTIKCGNAMFRVSRSEDELVVVDQDYLPIGLSTAVVFLLNTQANKDFA